LVIQWEFPGPFSRSAVNFNAGCKTAVSNIVMALAVMVTLLFLTPLFHYTPLVVLSSIIISAMLGLIDYEAAIHLWTVDKFDFIVCISAYAGVVFCSVEIGLVIAVWTTSYQGLKLAIVNVCVPSFDTKFPCASAGGNFFAQITSLRRKTKNIYSWKHSKFDDLQKC